MAKKKAKVTLKKGGKKAKPSAKAVAKEKANKSKMRGTRKQLAQLSGISDG